jgi:hypothetical protein
MSINGHAHKQIMETDAPPISTQHLSVFAAGWELPCADAVLAQELSTDGYG